MTKNVAKWRPGRENSLVPLLVFPWETFYSLVPQQPECFISKRKSTFNSALSYDELHSRSKKKRFMSSFLLTDRMTNHLTINDFPYFIEAARQGRAKGYHTINSRIDSCQPNLFFLEHQLGHGLESIARRIIVFQKENFNAKNVSTKILQLCLGLCYLRGSRDQTTISHIAPYQNLFVYSLNHFST